MEWNRLIYDGFWAFVAFRSGDFFAIQKDAAVGGEDEFRLVVSDVVLGGFFGANADGDFNGFIFDVAETAEMFVAHGACYLVVSCCSSCAIRVSAAERRL